MFTNFLSVTVASSNQRSAEEESFFNQPQPQGTQGGKLTKDSILALYGKNQPAPAPPPQVNTFPMQGEATSSGLTTNNSNTLNNCY